MLVLALVSSRLDYCNSLLYGIAEMQLRRLQSVQNVAARFVTGANRREHITPVRRRLHRLPIGRCIDFKLAVLMFKSLYGQLPPYLAKNCHLVSESS